MTSDTIVHRLYEDFTALTGALGQAVEPSLCVTANDCFRKALLLAAASHFERTITASVLAYVEASSQKNPLVREFVRQKGLSRQYHTLFQWDGKNANKFFSLFGDDFRKHAEKCVRGDSKLEDGIKAFLELGDDRNRLVHEDFGNFSLEKTADEIFALFERAQTFTLQLDKLLSECPLPQLVDAPAA
jgi:hypothetical protein